MTSFAIADLPLYPLTLADIRDNEVIVPKRRELEVDGADLAARPAPRSARSRRPARRRAPAARSRTARILYTTTQGDRASAAPCRRRARRTRDPIEAVLEAERRQAHCSRGKVHDVAAARDRGLPARASRSSRASASIAARRFALDFQNECAVGWRDGRAGGHGARHHLRHRQRLGRGDRHRGRCATASGSASSRLPAPAHPLDAGGAGARRAARLRLRPRLPLGLPDRARVGHEADRHRRRRHQHRCRAARGRPRRPCGVKTPTTEDVTDGIRTALAELIAGVGGEPRPRSTR